MSDVINIGSMRHETARRTVSARSKIVAGLDVGSSKISCVISERTVLNKPHGQTESHFRVVGLGHTASRGVHGGAIANVAEAERAIRIAVDEAEKASGHTLQEIFVAVSGGKPLTKRISATIKLNSRVVQQFDIEQAVAAALGKCTIGARAIVHLAPLKYSLDGVETDIPPVGMRGDMLGVAIALMTVESGYLENMTAAVERAHLSVGGFVLAPRAAALSCLTADEMQLGCVLVELGSAVTGVGVFQNGKLIMSDSVPIGGQHVTNDIARAFSTPIAHAERLKTLYGGALRFGKDEVEMLAIPRIGERGADAIRQISKAQLTAIVRPRLEEILELVGAKILLPEFGAHSFNRVILSGGGAQIPGLRELASSVFARDVRIASAPSVSGLPETMRQPTIHVAFGAAVYGMEPDVHVALPLEAAINIEQQRMGYVRRVGRWLIDSF